MASKLQELLRSVSKTALETPCSDEHIVEIANKVTSWRSIAPYLGLTAVDEENILQDHRDDVRIQRREMLRTWKKKLGSMATYGSLAEALYKIERVDLVEKVVELLTEEAAAATSSLGLGPPPHTKDATSSGALPILLTQGGATKRFFLYSYLHMTHHTHTHTHNTQLHRAKIMIHQLSWSS